VAQPLALGAQVLGLGLARIRGLDLAQLPLQQVELPIPGAGPRAQLVQPRDQLPLARVQTRERAAPRRLGRATEAVQDLELRRREREPPVLVLAVEGQQRAAGGLQIGRGGAAPAEVRARAALRADAAREHELLRVTR
jgi:hypothetical protein